MKQFAASVRFEPGAPARVNGIALLARRAQCLLPLAIAAMILVSAGCGSRKKASARVAEVDRFPHLEVIHAENDTSLVLKRTYTAIVDALEKAELTARVRGAVKVMSPNADIGRVVKKDEPLVVLDIPDIQADLENKKALRELADNQCDQAQHNLHVAEEEVNEAGAEEKKFEAEAKFRESQYFRYAELSKQGTVTPQQADEAKLQLGAAQAAIRAVKAKIQTKKAKLEAAKVEIKVADGRRKVAQAEVDRVGAMVGFATIRAPFDGIVTKRWVDRGAIMRDSAQPLLTVMRTDIVRVILDVPERDIPYLRAHLGKEQTGNPVELFIPSLQEHRPDLDFRGTVSLTAAALDPVTRTMRTEMHLANPTGYLRPQMSGTATVILAERKGVTVPATALVRRGDRTLIYYVANPTGEPPHGIVKPLEVQIGLDDGLRVEIQNPKLTGQELIIRKGNGVIRDGDQAIAIQARREELR